MLCIFHLSHSLFAALGVMFESMGDFFSFLARARFVTQVELWVTNRPEWDGCYVEVHVIYSKAGSEDGCIPNRSLR